MNGPQQCLAGTIPADGGSGRLVVIVGAAALLLVGATGAAVLAHSTGRHPAHLAAVVAGQAISSHPAAVPTLVIPGSRAAATPGPATLSWRQPLAVSAVDGTVTSVAAIGPQGPVGGTLAADGWTATAALLPSSTYTVHADVRDAYGAGHPVDRTLVTTGPDHLLGVGLSPGTGRLVGVGEPVVLQLDRNVNGPVARASLLTHLRVTASPPVEGAWRFYSSTEVHYRPRVYWRPGTRVVVRADLRGFHLPGTGTWGGSAPSTSTFSVGNSLVSTVDVQAHTMAVRRNGRLLRTVPVSTGRAQYPTKGGIHIVLTVERNHLYDSSTVGIPTAGPDGYYETLPYSMRISNAGAFVHANPATVQFQGRLNVSHGCVNLSLADAQWFYGLSRRGDIVDVVHAVIPPVLWDAGMADWNYSWPTWKAGNLNSASQG